MTMKTRLKALSQRLQQPEPMEIKVYYVGRTEDGRWKVERNGETQYMTDKEYSEWDAAQCLDGPVIEVKAPLRPGEDEAD